MNSFNYLIKTKIELKEEQLLAKEKELIKDYMQKVCISCLSTEKQIERECSLLKGGLFPACNQMGNCIHRKLKKENEALFKAVLAAQVERDSEAAYQIVDAV